MGGFKTHSFQILASQIFLLFKTVILINYVFTLGAIPEGLVHELPSADAFEKPPASEETTAPIDDLDDLRRQLEALNS